MGRKLTGEIEIMPGIVGPELITYDEPHFALPTPKGSIEYFSIGIRFDPQKWRYVCTELRAREITAELLRHAKIADWVGMALQPGFEGRAIRELPNPDDREPWGLTAPDGASKRPNERGLAWVAHLYRYGRAVSYKPTKAVEEGMKLPRSTASRWIAMARDMGYLGPSEGPGRAAG